MGLLLGIAGILLGIMILGGVLLLGLINYIEDSEEIEEE